MSETLTKIHVEALIEISGNPDYKTFWLATLANQQVDDLLKTAMREILVNGKASDENLKVLEEKKKAAKYLMEALQHISDSHFKRNGVLGAGIGGTVAIGTSSMNKSVGNRSKF